MAILGVDVGGTFTDAVLLDGDRLATPKVPTEGDQWGSVLAAGDAGGGPPRAGRNRRRPRRARSRLSAGAGRRGDRRVPALLVRRSRARARGGGRASPAAPRRARRR